MNRDLDWVSRAREGDRDAFGSLVQAHAGGVYAVALSILGNPEEAQDVVQETFQAVCEGLRNLQDPERFFAWLTGIARRISYDVLRRKYGESKHLPRRWHWAQAVGGGRHSPAGAEADQERDRLVQEAIGGLPEDMRQVVLLRYHAGRTYEEIARLLDLPPSTVRGQLYRARQILADRLKGLWQGRKP